MEVVDVSEMMGKGEVEETESARVTVGQPVRVRLEALPEIEWKATIAALRPTVYRQSPRTPIKAVWGTRASSKISSAVFDAWSPSLR